MKGDYGEVGSVCKTACRPREEILCSTWSFRKKFLEKVMQLLAFNERVVNSLMGLGRDGFQIKLHTYKPR